MKTNLYDLVKLSDGKFAIVLQVNDNDNKLKVMPTCNNEVVWVDKSEVIVVTHDNFNELIGK